MKFDDKTIEVLKTFASINQTILFVQGNILSTISPVKTLHAKAKLDQSFEKRFAIYDLPKLLGVLSLFSNPEVTVEDTSLKINENGCEVEYIFADERTIITPTAQPSVNKIVVEFDLKEQVIVDIQRALGVLSAPEILIFGDGNKIYISTYDIKNPGSHSFKIVVGSTTESFKLPIKAENWRLLPQDYKVEISKPGIARFTGNTKIDIIYWITGEAKAIVFHN
jgi:hypothetical protein